MRPEPDPDVVRPRRGHFQQDGGGRGIVAGQLAGRVRAGGRGIGRGKSQVEADILGCLDDGTLEAATLDVFESEPLSSESPLWAHPKVIVTPHNSADSEPDAIGRYVFAQIARIEAGETPDNLIDRKAGY